MPKRSRTTPKKLTQKRVLHTKQKPKPRHVSKAHQLERDENQMAFDVIRQVEATRIAS
jgi:hypothetical protein